MRIQSLFILLSAYCQAQSILNEDALSDEYFSYDDSSTVSDLGEYNNELEKADFSRDTENK